MLGWYRPLPALFVAILLIGMCAPLAPLFAAKKDPAEIYRIVSNSVVVVRAEPGTRGSGVIVDTELIVTNCHVIENSKAIFVERRGQRVPAKLVAADWHKDLCIINVSERIGQKANLQTTLPRIGDRVYSVGAPLGLELSLGDGLISGIRDFGDFTKIQTSAPISPGSSGGGLFNDEGVLIGITTSYLKLGQVLNFALPASYVSALLARGRSASLDVVNARPKPEDREIDWHAVADLLVKQNDWRGLLALSKKWTVAKPQQVSGWFYLSFASHNIGNYTESLSAAREAIRLNPNAAEAWLVAGSAYLTNRRPEEARQAFKRLEELRGAAAVPAGFYASALMRLGRKQEAVDVCGENSPYQRNAENSRFICTRLVATVHLESRNYAEAAKALQEHVELNPKASANDYLELALAYGNIGQDQGAAEALERAVKIDEKLDRAWGGLGLARHRLGQHRAAIIAYHEATRLNPSRAEYWAGLGDSYGAVGDSEAVSRVAERLRTINPEMADALVERHRKR